MDLRLQELRNVVRSLAARVHLVAERVRQSVAGTGQNRACGRIPEARDRASGASSRRRPGRSEPVSYTHLTATGELLLIREFRYPLNSWCIAFPAGLMEPGEDLATCVDRELREETGLSLIHI